MTEQQTSKNPKELNEHEIPDNYPVFQYYLYVLDGQVFRSPIAGTVKDVKRWIVGHGGEEPKSFKTCDIGGRNLWKYAV